jgi:hypothetical protein
MGDKADDQAYGTPYYKPYKTLNWNLTHLVHPLSENSCFSRIKLDRVSIEEPLNIFYILN